MAIFKGFRIQIVDGKGVNANVLYEAEGSVVLSLVTRKSSISTNTYFDPDPLIMENYTEEPGNVAGFSLMQSWVDVPSSALNKLLLFFPVAVVRYMEYPTGETYLRLLNGSGAYAVTGRLYESGTDTFDLYTQDGTRIGVGFTVVYNRATTYNSGLNVFTLLGTYDGDTALTADYQLNCGVALNNDAVTLKADSLTSTQSDNIARFLNLCEQYSPPPTDPYSQGGESDIGGGTGDFDGTSVDVDFASLPTLSAVDTGFISLYNPTLAQLQSLANYMWSDLFDLDTFKKLFGDPMQAILGLSIVPGPVPSGSAQVVKVGNISTGISMTKAATQYINVDCGTLNVEEFWGAYLDYEPYTKAEIFLPFIGVHQIAVDDIMNKPVHIMYHIDLLSGGCACEIKCGGSVLYTFIGSCAVSIPVTGSDWTNLINGVLSAASAIGTMVATGGATAPAAAGEIASAAVNSLKPSIEKSGSIAGAGGLLAGKVPVLILTRPRQALPGKQNTFTGYPAFITRSLGAISGYTEVHSIRLSGIDGTESEIDEIEELLKGGVIL